MSRPIAEILKTAKVIAVVGLSPDPSRDSHDVARYLQGQGYRIVPVNPAAAEVLGEKSYPSLKDVSGPVDVVDIFRRAEFVPAIVDEAIAKGAKAIWMQLGIVHEAAAKKAEAAGLDVVMDRCAKVEHARLKAQGAA
jgi:predicted CoA-binding protein